jgi:nucleotide-binding universal stress UspA family protein
MFNKILLAVGSDNPSWEHVHVAGRLAARFGAQLTIVSVSRPVSPTLGEPLYSQTLLPRLGEAETVLEGARSIAMAEGAAEPSTESLEGDPVERIATLANRGGFDLLVIGTRQRGRIGAALLGSVSAGVAARAHVPVLVVPESATATRKGSAGVSGVA